jgi:hypothetical protein
MSFRVIIHAVGEPDDCYQDTLRFATRKEAEKSGEQVAIRWESTRWYRVESSYVHETDDPVNCEFKDGRNVRLPEESAKSLDRRWAILSRWRVVETPDEG